MNIKKYVAILLVLILVVGLLPMQVLAQGSGHGSIVGQRSEKMTTRLAAAATQGPALAAGNHERWIDRIAQPPRYALDFYAWLENNMGADGALADPTRGLLVGETYTYLLHTIYSSAAFTYTGTDYDAAAQTAVLKDLGDAHMEVVNYAGAVYGAFDRDHPEVFWLSGSAVYGYSISYDYTYASGSGNVEYFVNLYFFLKSSDFDIRKENYQSEGAVAAAIEEQETAIERIIANCPDASDYDRIHYFNQVLTQTNCYNSAAVRGDKENTSADAWESISALKGSTGVEGPTCEGYARAFAALCRAMGYPCVLVEGPVKTSPSAATVVHMWNYVQLEGNWYAVDVTWNDPYSFSMPDTAHSGNELDTWVLLGRDTHVPGNMTFIESHAVTNYSTENSLQYVNGPVLSAQAYAPNPSVVVPTISLKYPSISFEDMIVMNVYYDVSDLEDVVEMGLITYSDMVDDYGVDTAQQVLPGYTFSEADGLYRSSTAGIAAKMLGDPICFAVYAKLTDGSYTYTSLVNYGPKDYAYHQLETGNEKMKPLVVAMLNYGTAAQTYFAYNTDAPVNGDLTVEQQALTQPYSDSMIASVIQPDAAKQGQMGSGGSCGRGYPTISFEGAFCINYYFTPNVAPVGEIIMYVWNQKDYDAAEVLDVQNATKAIPMERTQTGEYLATVAGIAAKELDKGVYISFRFSDGTADYCSGVIGYSVGVYCKAQAAKNGALAQLSAACAVYGYYAKQLYAC